MLSRTASNLYWLARYMERAECTARLLDMGQRIVMVPGADRRQEWSSILQATACLDYAEEADDVTQRMVVQRLLLDPDNASSINGCIVQARANAKAVRTALTQDTWETLNDSWRYFEGMEATMAVRSLSAILEWVRRRATTFRGAVENSMLRQDSYDFIRLGIMVERADMILRLLDVKYFVLLPETDVVGGGRDHYQWSAILRAVSGLRAYHHTYRSDFSPWKISDFLIFNRQFPRSVAFCYQEILWALERLENQYGQTHPVHKMLRAETDRLNRRCVDDVFQDGLHEFIRTQITTTNQIGAEIADAYHFNGV